MFDKNKILILITKSNWGGAQKYVFDIATNLPKDQYDIEVIFGGAGVLKQKLDQGGIKNESIKELERDINPLKDIKTLLKLIKLFREKKPDVLHLNSSKIGAMGAVAGRLTGVKKIIFTAHGWAFNENRSAISKIILKIIYWITIISSHKTIIVSDGMGKFVKKWLFIKNKIINIHNGVTEYPLLERTQSREMLSEKSPSLKNYTGNKWIGTIAELHSIKNIDIAIRAINEIQKESTDLKYIIIGEGEKRNELEKLIKTHKLDNVVFLIGAITEAGKYLKAFDIFILPSKSEGLPYVLLEAGLANIPTIATNVGGIPEIISDKKTGLLVRPNNEKELASAIKYYLENPLLMIEYANNLKNKVQNEFSIEQMITKTLEVYK